jgi:hypothetical protein
MRATRFFRISAANIGPNRFHQNRTVSWLMSIPRSDRRSSKLRLAALGPSRQKRIRPIVQRINQALTNGCSFLRGVRGRRLSFRAEKGVYYVARKIVAFVTMNFPGPRSVGLYLRRSE